MSFANKDIDVPVISREYMRVVINSTMKFQTYKQSVLDFLHVGKIGMCEYFQTYTKWRFITEVAVVK